ncbi:LysR family transcriptional regulator [Corynebacterium glyciniphilum]|uniref:LysR family transcriptional regulator n=1 Tax=Corynebacterium glyciniphilum TaxID=1404244 RepID=UPI0026520DA5|nr:LysR family transcriptional regulator [Corynebacterium glyciniphilum]MDN5682313.1 LysR family transcriptional regulator [Corynebacterium glyciniphilum]MDN6705241.1 LysR family transcriptional regulator [Corynebacterium glyciniphilum]
MELQQLRYVLAVAETRNFTRAAERCHIVQSAMSHQIKVLEHELGVQLFARTSRRVELTDAGAAFLPSAQASLDAADRAAADAAAATGRIRGTVTIGVIPTVTAIDVPAVLGRFHQAHPAVKIRLLGGSSDEFIAAIRSGGMDVAVLGLPAGQPPRGVRSQELVREDLVAVVSATHRLAGRGNIALADLDGEAFVDFPVDSPGRVQSDVAFRDAGLTRDVAFEAVDTTFMLEVVRQGLAVALLSRDTVPEGADVHILDVADGPSRIQYLAWSDFNPGPATTALVAMLTDQHHDLFIPR